MNDNIWLNLLLSTLTRCIKVALTLVLKNSLPHTVLPQIHQTASQQEPEMEVVKLLRSHSSVLEHYDTAAKNMTKQRRILIWVAQMKKKNMKSHTFSNKYHCTEIYHCTATYLQQEETACNINNDNTTTNNKKNNNNDDNLGQNRLKQIIDYSKAALLYLVYLLYIYILHSIFANRFWRGSLDLWLGQTKYHCLKLVQRLYACQC